ncbi:hypothetical protein EH244_17660 [Variovorax beijingensis]|uniref:Uncharacterized protein n=1 Tax=Variovorax beijingensis TaxID=2496117 RepID=A0A3P3EM94_9BURK|nr:hypothetical protein [Variovorax beijingensis]RRH87321.1 hypothetical protein EH244_17660 [Variovorax beijingensis]RSZ35611.1 hypothetical protein EJO66_16630 [Variovorax beijingensis]
MSKSNPNTPDERGSLPLQHNKAGHQSPTPRNEPRRTTESRHDRESHVGGSNQSQSRRGGGGSAH